LPHEGIQSLVPYQPGKSIDELKFLYKRDNFIKLASNENPLGASPKALAALRNIDSDRLSYYPAPDYHPLKPKLAEKLGVSVDCLTLSAGSDTLFSLLMTAFALHRNKSILTHDKAFMTYGIQAQVLNIPTQITPLKANWCVDINAIIDACHHDTALIFIANPNNPTGLAIPSEEIIHLLNHIPKTTLLVLDEAYYEFSNPYLAFESIPLLKNHPNLVITRTF
jgi:histidinol-phosphate aminotransferase